MFDKWKAKRELVKAFKFYHKEYNKACGRYHYTFDTEFQNKNYDVIDEAYDNMKSLEKIVHALAYVLYSNFHISYWKDDGWWIETYYDLYKDESKAYLDEINKIHDDGYSCVIISDNMEINKSALHKGDLLHCLEDGEFYLWDGKNFLICN